MDGLGAAAERYRSTITTRVSVVNKPRSVDRDYWTAWQSRSRLPIRASAATSAVMASTTLTIELTWAFRCRRLPFVRNA